MIDTKLVMHGLAVKKLGSAASVAAILGVEEAEVAPVIETLVAEKKAVNARGNFMLTPSAQAELKESYAGTFAALRDNTDFTGAYDRFEVVNREVKQLVTDWQTMTVAGEQVPNDHSDADYDAKCVDRLGELHERAQPIVSAFAAVVSRFGAYGERLEGALDRLEAGEQSFFSGAKVDSYHTVWFELHEDLLRLLGRTRDE